MKLIQSINFISINFILSLLLICCVSKKSLVTIGDEVNTSEPNRVDVNILLQSTYLPDKKDIQLILHNSNTGLYYFKYDDCIFKATKSILQEYEDSLLTIKKPTKTIITYQNGLEIKREILGPENFYWVTDHIRNKDGILLKSVVTKNKIEENRYEYRYEKDRIYQIYIEKNKIFFYDTYFLNEKKQCYRKISQSPNHDIDSDWQYFYDDKGRNIKISYGTYEIIFTYLNNTDNFYSTLKNYDLEPRILRSSIESIKEGKKRTIISRDDTGNIQSKMIYITEPNCNTTKYTYNRKNELIHISVSTIAE